MLVIGEIIFENAGYASPALALRERLARAYAAHRQAEVTGVELNPEYLEWLNYIFARARYGLARPWRLPQAKVVDYLRWLIASSDGPATPQISSII